MQGRLETARTSFGIGHTTMPPEYKKANFTMVWVYAQSSFVESTSPDMVRLHDAHAHVSGLGFVDQDMDANEVGGKVTWSAAMPDVSRVVNYSVYFAEDAAGKGKSQIGEDLPASIFEIDFPSESPILNLFTFHGAHLPFYIKNKETGLCLNTRDLPVKQNSRIWFQDNCYGEEHKFQYVTPEAGMPEGFLLRNPLTGLCLHAASNNDDEIQLGTFLRWREGCSGRKNIYRKLDSGDGDGSYYIQNAMDPTRCYIYIYIYLNVYLSIYLSLSLYICICVYIYVYIHI